MNTEHDALQAEAIIKVEFHDLDPMQVVWHGNYARYFESARSALLDRIGYNYKEMVASGFSWPIVELKVKYVKPIGYGAVLRVVATLKEYEFKLRIAYEIFDAASGERLTRAETTQLPVEAATGELRFGCPSDLVERVRRCLA